MRTVETPVLIVGRGPVGMTLALRLARLGIPSVVADRVDAEIRLSSKAVLMHGESIEVLERAGVGREVARTGIALSGSRTFYRDRELFHTEFGPAPEHGFPQVLNFPQSETELLLLSRVQAEPLVDLQLATELTELAADASGVTAVLDDGAGGLRVRAGYVAGCDGARSTVRKQLPIAFTGHSHDDHYLIVDIRAQLALPHERRFYFDPPSNRGRTILVHPQHGDLWHLDFQVGAAPDLDEELRTGRLDERIRGVIGPARYELVWSTTYVFKQLLADRFSHGRAFLVGDAAHLYAPYGARGLNSGFADADNLAWKLAWVLHGRAPATLLDSYDLERRAAATEHFRATSATAGFMAPTTRRGRLYRDAVLAVAARLPAARRFVDSGRFYAPVGYPSSPITTPNGGGEAGVEVGAMMPDVTLRLLPDRRSGRLRDLVGDSFLLVHAAPDVRCATEVRAALVDGLADRASEVSHLTVLPPGVPEPSAEWGMPAAAEARLRAELDAPVPGTANAGWLLLVRPDCHVAARVALGSAAVARSRVRGLLDRACGRTTGPVGLPAPSSPGQGS